jgi:hypothetical protein
MSPIPGIVEGWRDIQGEPRRMAHAKSIVNSVARYNPEAAKLVKYLGEMVTLACGPDLLAQRVFPNAKEISESFAAFDAVRNRMLQFDLSDPTITAVCVGDGVTPRTGATFAFRTRWQVYSVDPKLRGGTQRWRAIQRLTILADQIERVRIKGDRVILVAVHSHARLPESVASIAAREIAVVAIPCCVPQRLSVEPDVEYEDKAIISPCRTVRIWHRLPGNPAVSEKVPT